MSTALGLPVYFFATHWKYRVIELALNQSYDDGRPYNGQSKPYVRPSSTTARSRAFNTARQYFLRGEVAN